MYKLLLLLVLMAGSCYEADGGVVTFLAGYGLCQTACNAAWVACCTTAGVTAGTVTAGVGVAPAVLACSSLQGICMAACAVGFAVVPAP